MWVKNSPCFPCCLSLLSHPCFNIFESWEESVYWCLGEEEEVDWVPCCLLFSEQPEDGLVSQSPWYSISDR